MRSILAIVLGYGLDQRKVKPYYLEVAEYLRLAEPKATISSGGFTDPKHYPGLSEAELGWEIMGFDLQGTKLLEDRSWTTIENLLFSDAIIRMLVSSDGLEFDRIIIFCENIRAFKIKVMAKLILGTMFHRPIKVIGIGMQRTVKEKIIQWFIKTPLEILDCLFHFPGQFMTARRFAEWQTSGHKD